MKLERVVAMALAFGVIGCSQKEETPAPSSQSGHPLNAPMDYLGSVVKAPKTAAKVVGLANLNQAVQQFSAAENRYPSSLQELVTTGYLPAIPEAPPGSRFVYDPQKGQVQLVNP